MRGALLILVIAATLAYPLAVYAGLRHFSPQVLAAALAALLAARLLIARPRHGGLAGLALLAFAVLAMWRDDEFTLRLYPVLVNLTLLALFAWTLWRPPSLIERLARWREPELPAAAVRYTRGVTLLWCFFFLLNGTLALYTARFTSVAIWSLYNGLISYLLMAVLFAGEWLYRRRARARHAKKMGHPKDEEDHQAL
ncbi:COG4648 family protein [Alloalcanivorax mobilis]|uniref:COG4648 family protein n=1 Tax=Alloalcanivorax mobilis TaxID=2019569 RepID=UPI000B5B3A85|nr:hypothetical protein [Alloalcanivorax mobilis]ASK32965.1 hypothetical protein CEK62_00495 [Alcanivorax sp. N3-2A]ASK36783.1 hypothetical protein CEK62_20690 [Alcanivorax sp. N3-2A]|tara:strand:- start:35375 stop:35965 length:591 start_codon:yes stop_codon:yes gene_type:complete